MGFRFNRRIRIAPGIRLNLSKSGLSTSVGGRGAWFTFGRRRPRATISLPGTGLSYSESLGGPPPAGSAPLVTTQTPVASDDNPAQGRRPRVWLWILLALALVPVVWALLTM